MSRQRCFIDGCDQDVHGLGMCKFHYQRYTRGIDLYQPKKQSNHHGLSEHPYYTKWANILDRCYNPRCKFYHNYGGRGIKVFTPWIKNPDLFIKYITALPKLSPSFNSIDRIDNNGDYEPGNLRWATKSQQVMNTRTQKSRLGIKGVYKNRSRYRARINVNKTRVELGSFSTIEEAARARKIAERRFGYGDYS